ncbi:ribose-5-phosphate isomerase RpiA [Paenibacillus oenotherae]|uniref:Ribose-5-phosphate isomerase A n=1 Tax=Paenibacillus oenotherae TaxID=1435645 RepID=A0ABS7D1M5_9BACL|nr:ribose-5-phosphate isomerase RpiA [Paenibacillus oenotherae]
MNAKKTAAEKAVEYIKDGMTVGLGTGSTAYWAIRRIGERVQEGLNIRAIATSRASEELAVELGIAMMSSSEAVELDLTIDGADEVDRSWSLIKGGGGALLREKIVASISKQLIIIVDESKVKERLGGFALPVEVIPFGYEITMRQLSATGCTPVLRMLEGKPYWTDNGNYIVDCDYGDILHPSQLAIRINAIPGVVDNGLFVGMAGQVIVGYGDGTVKQLERRGSE